MGARVYSYIRFSDARQAAGHSSERQRDFAARWAAEHGLELDEQLTMRDEGLSAYHQRHITQGALGVFLAAVQAGQVAPGSVLVVEGLDRLSRAEPLQAQAQLASIIHAGLSVVTAADGRVYSRETLTAQPMDLVYSLLVMIRAHEESATKSRRVRDAIRRQCLAWQSGSYRGLIRYGNTPSWLRALPDGSGWALIPERAAAVRVAIEMALRGLGTGHIVQHLHATGQAWSDAAPTTGHLSRLLRHEALRGDKAIELDGERYLLAGYYPALVDTAGWDQLQLSVQARGRVAVRGQIPSILTGTGVASCGYCGAALKAQTMASKRRPDGSLPDSQRRLQCSANNRGGGCAVPGSCSAAPIERAIIDYCSDILNLRALDLGDASALPRAELVAAEADLARLDQQLDRLTDALLAGGESPAAAFARRARALEAERARAAERAAEAERALAQAARADAASTDQRWRAVAAGVQRLDTEARLQARQLIVDTFERLVVWHHGIRPRDCPPGSIDVLLVARSGISRAIRVTASGRWTVQQLPANLRPVPGR